VRSPGQTSRLRRPRGGGQRVDVVVERLAVVVEPVENGLGADKSAHYDMEEPIGVPFQETAVFLETGGRIGGRARGQAAA
jgi:hypothetical protein